MYALCGTLNSMFGSCPRYRFPRGNDREYGPSGVINLGGRVVSGDISSNGKYVISAAKALTETNDGTVLEPGGVRINNVDTTAVICELDGFGREVTACKMDPSGSRCAVGTRKGLITQLTVPKGRMQCSFAGHEKDVTGITYSVCGHTLVSSSRDLTARLWDSGSGTGQLCATFQHIRYVASVDVCPDIRTLYTSCGDTNVRGWDIRSGREAFLLQGHTNVARRCCASRDGSLVASCSQDGTVRLWDVRRRAELVVIDFQDAVHSCDMTPDGRYIVACGDYGRASMFDVTRPDQPVRLLSNERKLNSCSISKAGNRAITCSDDGSVRLYLNIPTLPLNPSLTAALALPSIITDRPSGGPSLRSVDSDETSSDERKDNLKTDEALEHANREPIPTDVFTEAGDGYSLDSSNIGSEDLLSKSDFQEAHNFGSSSNNAKEDDISDGRGAKLSVITTMDSKDEDGAIWKAILSRGQGRVSNRGDEIRALNVEQVSELMCHFVCEPLNKEKAAEMKAIIRCNVDKRSISGRGIMMRCFSKEFVAQSILFLESPDLSELQKDFMYLELVEFIRQLRIEDGCEQ